MGWGIGNTSIHASKNEIKANKLSSREGGNCVFIIDEDREIGPIYKEEIGLSKEDNYLVDEISKELPLSKINIGKILAVINETNSNEVSAETLAQYMGITIRSANRILNNLLTHNFATTLEVKDDTKRGRPKKIYKIEFDKFLKKGIRA